MKKKPFNLFLQEVFPILNPFLRKNNGLIHNLIKWIALRLAYFFYRIGLDVNILDIIALLLLFPITVLIYFSLTQYNPSLFILAFFFMGCVLFVDFVDGSLASISNYKTKIGDELDNLCPEICRFSGLVIIGYISNSQIYFIISIMTAVMINSFVLKTRESIPQNFKWLKAIFFHKMSINGIRVLVFFIMPFCSLLHIYHFQHSSQIAIIIISIYFILTLTWIVITLKDKKIKV